MKTRNCNPAANLFRVVLCGGMLLASLASAVDPTPQSENSADQLPPTSIEPTREQLDFFEKKIRPILVARCHSCHGEKKQSGELRLDSFAAIMAGGESGETILAPGKPDESLLIDAIRYNNYEMPPTGRLPAAEVELLEQWVTSGAAWPKEKDNPLAVRPKNRGITEEDRQWWSFQPITRPEVPQPADDQWSRNPIDRFILARLQQEGIAPSAMATPRELARRLKTDLIGLPLSAEEVESIAANNSDDAYEQLTDQWLASPQFGERWGRHWLDLVRYAESDGFRQDAYRPRAWLYRDYVIRAFNSDKPYDRFVAEQLAGDEIYPPTSDTAIATGFLRAGVYEYNQRDVFTQWDNMVNEMTDVTADVFLGLSMGCARCHDHKYDPIAQDDYFRLRGVFTAINLRDDLPLPAAESEADQLARYAEWEQKTADLRAEQATLEEGARQRASRGPIEKFPPEVREIFAKPESFRTPFERQIATLAWRQVEEELAKLDFAKVLKGEEKERWERCRKDLAELMPERPTPPGTALGVTDIGAEAPTITSKRGQVIEPGPPQVFTSATLEAPVIFTPPAMPGTTGRRTALAQWIANSQNPLTARVIVNRMWQYHFGRGISETTSDLGRLGSPPTHPELIDWLAAELIESGWSLKHIHRLMVTSSTYRQASHGVAAADSFAKDASNRWWGRTLIRRLDAEIIRDSVLCTTGEFTPDAGGPSVELNVPRRTIYTKVLRNKFDPLLDEFDVPDNIIPAALRNTTVTPNQSLLLVNGDWLIGRAKVLAKLVAKSAGKTPDEQISFAYRRVFAREPSAAEKDAALDFFYKHSAKDQKPKDGEPATPLVDFCHVLLNGNEFLYVD